MRLASTKICGCYYLDDHPSSHPRQPNRLYLPLLDVEAHAVIVSTTSKTTLKQTFTNPQQEAIKECIYAFPLYDGVSVISFTCTIGDRVLRGKVTERYKATATFNQAVARGESAGLLEQLPEASDVFSTKLGNVPAGGKVVVELSYVGELNHDAETDGIRFTIPTKIAPRYGTVAANSSISDNAGINKDSSIRIVVDASMAEGTFIQGIQSPSHPIAVSMGAVSTDSSADPVTNRASAALTLQTATLENDFVLTILAREAGMPKAILETHPTIPKHRALMVTLVPKFKLPPSRPEIVFVADRSGSMQGNIPTLISAMKVFLKSMPVGVKFNICSFGSSHSFLWPKSRAYGKETLEEATGYVSNFAADFGGTETHSAIKAAIDQRYKDLQLEVILLTDGDIWGQDELFHYLNQQVIDTDGGVRVFPLGIGTGVSHALIEGVARAANGFAQTVLDGEKLENRVVRMLKGALSPHINDYSLEVKYAADDTSTGTTDDGFELVERVSDGVGAISMTDVPKPNSVNPKDMKPVSLYDASVDSQEEKVSIADEVDSNGSQISVPKMIQAPHQILALFPFMRTSVYLLMSLETMQKRPKSVVLRGTSIQGPVELEIPIDVLSQPGETIHQLAARKAVQDLEEGRGWLYHATDDSGVLLKGQFPSRFNDMVEREAVRLGEMFQIAGKWCSFVAVDPSDPRDSRDYRDSRGSGDSRQTEGVFTSNRTYGAGSGPFGNVYPTGVAQSNLLVKAPRQMSVRHQRPPIMQVQDCSFMARQIISAKRCRTSIRSGQGALMSLSATAGGTNRGEFRSQNTLAPAFHSYTPPTPPTPPSVGYRGGRGLGRGGALRHPKILPDPDQGEDNDAEYRRYAMEEPCSRKRKVLVDPRQMSDSQKVLALIALQDFEGYWDVSEELLGILGVRKESVVENPTPKVWATVTVVYYLERKMQAEEGVWELVVEKARLWLAGTGLDAGSLQRLEHGAEQLIGH